MDTKQSWKCSLLISLVQALIQLLVLSNYTTVGVNSRCCYSYANRCRSWAGPFHSQSNEAWFTHTPGLNSLSAFPSDAKGLAASIEDPNPVMFFGTKHSIVPYIRGS